MSSPPNRAHELSTALRPGSFHRSLALLGGVFLPGLSVMYFINNVKSYIYMHGQGVATLLVRLQSSGLT